jgi:tetratricopeptide (TPR) repeat protein
MVLAAGDPERGEGERALARLDKVQKILPDAPYPELLRSVACVSLGRNEAAVKHARAFLRRMGPDVTAYTVLAQAAWRLGNADVARSAAEKACADDPARGLPLAWLAISTPQAARGPLTYRVRALAPRGAQFGVLARTLRKESAGAQLWELADAYRKLEPELPEGPYHAAHGRLLMEDTQGALPLFQAALKLAPAEEEFAHYQRPLLEILAQQHKPGQAYRLARDKEAALAFLHPILVKQQDAAALESLVSQVPKGAKGVLKQQRDLLVAHGEYLREQYQDVIARLTPWVERIQALRDAAGEEDEVLDPRLRLSDAETILIRSLIRTDRLEEAEQLARPIHEDHEDPRHLALVLLAQRNYDEALGILAWVVAEEWWSAREMLVDPDIEKHLSHEALASFREELEDAASGEDE